MNCERIALGQPTVSIWESWSWQREEGEQRVGQALKKLIERGCRVRLQVLKEALLEPASPAWEVQVPEVDIHVYDRLLSTRESEVRA